jgi:hypothetical protein
MSKTNDTSSLWNRRRFVFAFALSLALASVTTLATGVATASPAEASLISKLKLMGGGAPKFGGKGFNLAALFGGKGLGGKGFGRKMGY